MKEDEYTPSNCPFCKTDLYNLKFFEHKENVFSMKCEFCDCTGPIALTREEAIKKWNRRTR